jgi:N-acetylglucosaminyl-diphospho-decaprenol L-rhamnosyltransferase
MLCVSIVSHGQGNLIKPLLQDIAAHCDLKNLTVILTLNVPESLPFDPSALPVKIQTIHNNSPNGFGANHNAAFKFNSAKYFCVLNPDVRFECDPFPVLLDTLADPTVGLVAPLVLGPDGGIEDNARRFPTALSMIKKALLPIRNTDYEVGSDQVFPDWVAGMFMLWRAEVFERLRGFDEGFFLYYEDVDVCARLRQTGLRIAMTPDVRVIHHARRSSHGSLRYMRWHLKSLLRYLKKRADGSYRYPCFRLP